MDIRFDGDHATITLENGTCDVDLRIDAGNVHVTGYYNTPGDWADLDFTVSPGSTWTIWGHNDAKLRTQVTAVLVAVDQWATPERFAQARADAAQAKVEAAALAQERATAALDAAVAHLDALRAEK